MPWLARDPPPAGGQIDQEVPRGLINHRLLPVREGRPVLVDGILLVAVALALHPADRTNPVQVRVESNPGIKLWDRRGLVHSRPSGGNRTSLDFASEMHAMAGVGLPVWASTKRKWTRVVLAGWASPRSARVVPQEARSAGPARITQCQPETVAE